MKVHLQSLVEEARNVATRSDLNFRIGAILILETPNGLVKIAGYNHRRTCFITAERKTLHAEMHCLKKAKKRGLMRYIRGAVMVVVRRHDNRNGCAKPCELCYPVLSKLGLTVYYTA